MKIALVVNPYSGRKRGGKLLPLVKQKLKSHGIDYEFFASRFHGHVSQICSKLNISKYDAVVSMGGDGTNYQILNGLLSAFKPDQLPPLGIIPVGSGNSFAKDLDINSIDDSILAIGNNKAKRVDVCSFAQTGQLHYFVNLTGLGFVTDVAQTADRLKIFKELSYLAGVIYRTFTLHFHFMELEIDGRSITGENCFVEFCNSRYTGGNMLIAPDARIDDGLMDIVIAGKLSRASLLATLPRIFNGTHLRHPAVTCIKAKKATIRTIPKKRLLPDGEIFGTTPATIKVHPQLIRYLF